MQRCNWVISWVNISEIKITTKYVSVPDQIYRSLTYMPIRIQPNGDWGEPPMTGLFLMQAPE